MKGILPTQHYEETPQHCLLIQTECSEPQLQNVTFLQIPDVLIWLIRWVTVLVQSFGSINLRLYNTSLLSGPSGLVAKFHAAVHVLLIR